MSQKNPTSTKKQTNEIDPELNQLVDDFVQFSKDLDGESDRASVVLAASAMDELLRQVLLATLVIPSTSSDSLLDGDSPLSTFSSRIKLTYRLGLIDADFSRALDLYRRIRNEFAHGTSRVSVESQKDRVRELSKMMSCTAFDYIRSDKDSAIKNHTGCAKDLRLISAFLFVRLQNTLRHTTRIKAEPMSLAFDLEEDNS